MGDFGIDAVCGFCGITPCDCSLRQTSAGDCKYEERMLRAGWWALQELGLKHPEVQKDPVELLLAKALDETGDFRDDHQSGLGKQGFGEGFEDGEAADAYALPGGNG